MHACKGSFTVSGRYTCTRVMVCASVYNTMYVQNSTWAHIGRRTCSYGPQCHPPSVVTVCQVCAFLFFYPFPPPSSFLAPSLPPHPPDLSCFGLRSKLFGHPDPYLKLQVSPQPRTARQPHHGQRVVTEFCHDSIHPCWLLVCPCGMEPQLLATN